MKMSSQFHAPAALIPGKHQPVAHGVSGWLGLVHGLGAVYFRELYVLSRNRSQTAGLYVQKAVTTATALPQQVAFSYLLLVALMDILHWGKVYV
jgi:hypothetical protein